MSGNKIKNEKGFTLIEVILVVILIGIVAIAMTSAFIPTMTVAVNIDNRKEAFQQGRLAIERMMREIREARVITTIPPPPAGPTTIRLTKPDNTTIQYSWGGTALNPLQRSRDDLACCTMVDIACCVQARAPNTDILFYFDMNGASTTTPASVWRAQAVFQVKVGDQTIDLRSEAQPRGCFLIAGIC